MVKARGLVLLFLLVMSANVFAVHAQESVAPPAAYRLDLNRLKHVYQSWNNCGPATLTMSLGYFGYPIDGMVAQEAPAAYLKPTRDDGNVSFWQMADYVNNQIGAELGIRAVVRRGGDLETVKRLLASDLPVILGKGVVLEDEGWVGHFVLAMGYDDTQGVLFTYDSLQGHGHLQGLPLSYSSFQPLWDQFNDVFLLIYPTEREDEVSLILGDLWDEQTAWEQARDAASARLVAAPDDAWANFNLGEALTALGDYDAAIAAYELAFAKHELPFRVLWYMQGLFEAYYQTGQFDKVLEWVRFVQDLTPFIEDMNYYRGLVYAAQGDTAAALEQLGSVLDFNQNFSPAAEAITQIESGVFAAPKPSGG